MKSAAFETWNQGDSVESLEARIHDGVPRDQLKARADGYLQTAFEFFPDSAPRSGGRLLEIGSGLGYLMQASARRFAPDKVVGLDVAENMIARAKERMERDGSDASLYEFVHYDGIEAPLPDDSFDLIFSFASIQHIPKEFAYHLFGEFHRLLKPEGHAVFQLIAYSGMPAHDEASPLREEFKRQARNEPGHWHFFYGLEELRYLLGYVYGVSNLKVREQNGVLWCSFGK